MLIIFTRTPETGAIKTRLVPELGVEGVMTLYQSLLKQTLTTASRSDISQIQLWSFPTIANPVLEQYAAEFNVGLQQQQGNDLGERMHNAFTQVMQYYRSAIIIGCDIPELSAQDLNTAAGSLGSGYDTVLGPAEDGGYYLIGMNSVNKALFKDIAWGSHTVLSATRQRIRENKLACYELPEHWDLDQPEDLDRYRELGAISHN